MKDEARTGSLPRLRLLPFLGALLLVACSGDGTEALPPETAEVGVVLSSTELSLTIFDVEDPTQTRTVGLAPDGSPGLDGRAGASRGCSARHQPGRCGGEFEGGAVGRDDRPSPRALVRRALPS